MGYFDFMAITIPFLASANRDFWMGMRFLGGEPGSDDFRNPAESNEQLGIHLSRQVVSLNAKGVESSSPGLPVTATPGK